MANWRRIVNVVVASPSDIPEIRGQIPFMFMRWSARRSDVQLMPIMSESHASPRFGGEPQSLLNSDLLPQADLLIALFWSKVGTPTENYPSGTIEEVERFCAMKGDDRAMVYFYSKPILEAPTALNLDELTRLKEFKASIQKRSIYHEFSSEDGLEADLHRHLDMKVKNLKQDRYGLEVTEANLEATNDEKFLNLNLKGTIPEDVDGVRFHFGVQSPVHVWIGKRIEIAGGEWRTNIWVAKGAPTTLVCFVVGDCGEKQILYYRRVQQLLKDVEKMEEVKKKLAMLLDEQSPDITPIWTRPIEGDEVAGVGPLSV